MCVGHRHLDEHVVGARAYFVGYSTDANVHWVHNVAQEVYFWEYWPYRIGLLAAPRREVGVHEL